MDRRGDTESRRVADGFASLWCGVPDPRLHGRSHDGGLLDVLRREVPGARAPGGPASAPLAGLSAPGGSRGVVRREVRLGARELVRAERRGRGREPAPSRLGRPALVTCDRGRAPCVPRGRGSVRRVVVREDRGVGRGRRRAARVALRQPRCARGRCDHVHADGERAWRDRMRLHGHAARDGALPDRHRHRLRPPRSRLDPATRS